MHIPDGFLSAGTWIPAWLISVAGIGFALKRAARKLKDKTVPLLGVTAAFIFAAQMLNFPIMAGTSGHLLGASLAAVLLGPYAGTVSLTCVLIVQCLIFQDGGLTSLGANILNMAIAATMGGYFIYCRIRKLAGIIPAVAFASWFSVVIASGLCALELAFSGVSPLKVVLSVMLGVHALIGIGEALITSLVIGFVLKVRPDLIYGAESRKMSKKEIIFVLLATLFLTAILLPFASSLPDGLERALATLLKYKAQ